jgi:hypothetical protein
MTDMIAYQYSHQLPSYRADITVITLEAIKYIVFWGVV